VIEPTGGGPSFDVPGEPGALRAHAGRLRAGAGSMDGTAGALGGACTGSWTGLAADAFRASQSGQVAAWSYGADAVRRAAAALEAYAGALADAQRRAAAAGRIYEQGVTVAQAAETSYAAAVSRAQQAPPGSVIVVPTFTDPGAAQREAALGEMVSLRAAVDQAAASCADAVRAAAGAAPLRPVVPAPAAPKVGPADGMSSGGLMPGLPTDSASLQRLLDEARRVGLPPTDYAGILKQYWAVRAAEHAGIDLATWNPTLGVDGNRATIEQVYVYYGQLFLQHPELQWAGMANMIGPAFAAGFFDLDALKDIAGAVAGRVHQLPGWAQAGLPPELQALSVLGGLTAADLRFYERTFLAMQKRIFIDQGGMHEAYLSGTPGAIDEMQRATLIDGAAARAWHDIATARPGALARGNYALLDREQNQIIAGQYDDMRKHLPSGPAFTYALTAVGAPTFPAAHTPGQFEPLRLTGTEPVAFGAAHVSEKLTTSLPDFDLSYREARWKMVSQDTLPAYQHLLATDPQRVRDIVGSDVGARIDEQRLWRQKDAVIQRLLSGWDVDVSAGPGPG